MRLSLGPKKKGIDYFGRFLNNFLSLSFDTTSKHRPVYAGLTLGSILNKNLEVEFEYDDDYYRYFYVSAAWTTKQDHCGPSLTIALFNIELNIQIYDSRHWFYKKNRFYLPGEEMCLIEARRKNKVPIEKELDEIHEKIHALEIKREKLLEQNKLSEEC